jgi:TolB-like protein
LDQAVALSPSEVRAELERLQRSSLFAGSVRLLAFLRFVVDETLKGCGRSLKEAVIGNTVYSREPPYDPLIDSTVRVEAARLRRKLKEYYAGEGRLNPVAITLPTGGYVPAFVANRGGDRAQQRAATTGGGNSNLETWSGATIAVMPIRVLTGDPADDLFAQTLSGELVAGLAGSPGLRAVSHVTAQQSKDRTDSQAVSAGDLGVDALLRGALCRSGGVVGVTVELCDQRGLVLWTERFVAPRLDGAALRRWICAAVLGRVRFDGCSGPHAVETLATILRARQLLDEQTPGALRVALQLFSSICRSAPDYARGHAGVADAYCDLYRLGLVSRAMALGAAKPAALRALQIDPQSIEAHVALATVSCWLERGRMATEVNFDKALGLGEDARGARLYAKHLTLIGRHEEAAAMFGAARLLEPHSVHQEIVEARSQYHARRYGNLVAAGRDEDARPRSVEALFYRALALVLAGEHDAARPFVAEIGQAAGKCPDLTFARAELEAWLGEPQRASALLEGGADESTHFALATLAAAVGDDHRCLDELEAAVNRREYSTLWLRGDARFDGVRDCSRFVQLLERLDGDQAELSYCEYLIDHDLCPRGFTRRSVADECPSARQQAGRVVRLATAHALPNPLRRGSGPNGTQDASIMNLDGRLSR